MLKLLKAQQSSWVQLCIWLQLAVTDHHLYILWSGKSNISCQGKVRRIYEGLWQDILSIKSLVPRRFEWNFRSIIFKLILVFGGWGPSCEISRWWMPLDLTDDKSTLVQVMAWYRQATSHYLSQCWPSFMSPYGVIRPQCVNGISLGLVDPTKDGPICIWHLILAITAIADDLAPYDARPSAGTVRTSD